MSIVVLGARVLVASDAEGVTQQAAGMLNSPFGALWTQLQVELACPHRSASERAYLG